MLLLLKLFIYVDDIATKTLYLDDIATKTLSSQIVLLVLQPLTLPQMPLFATHK